MSHVDNGERSEVAWTDRVETRHFKRDTKAPYEMRRLVKSVVRGWAVEPALLAASEIISNAVRHGEADSPDVVVATVSQRSGEVSVEVEEKGRFAPGERQRDSPGGFGLGIVDEIVTAWGVEQRGCRVRVWFTLDATDPRNAD
jgi:two-component sensor histidine kinase